MHASGRDELARTGNVALRSAQAGRTFRSANRETTTRGRSAATRGSGRTPVEPRRIPDASAHTRTAACVSHDSGAWDRGISALWVDPPQFVRQFAERADAGAD